MTTARVQRQSPSGRRVELSGTITHDFPSIAASSVSNQNVPITGVEPGDTVILTPLAALSVGVGLLPGFCVTAGTAVIPVINPTAGALDPASAQFAFRISRY